MYNAYRLLLEIGGTVGQDADSVAEALTSRGQLSWSRLTTGRDKSKLIDTVFERHS